jgi:aryl-alcohol dehydrogenase-like predicted oxidoreductase
MTLSDASPDRKTLILGTALWGWSVDRVTAHHILDKYVALGGHIIDTAVNYPINKKPEDFGLAVTWISDWIKVNGPEDLSVLVKIGSTDNIGGTSSDLGVANIIHSEAFLRYHFNKALAAIAIHWDNRGEEGNDHDGISKTINALSKLQETGLSIGFSGVKRPDLYLKLAPELADKWWIQVKENVLTSEAYLNYVKYFPKAHYLAYGINMGGLTSEVQSENSSAVLRGIKRPENLIERLSAFINTNHKLEPAPKSLNELALLSSFINPALCGVIIGPRNKKQLENSMFYWDSMKIEGLISDLAMLHKLKNI